MKRTKLASCILAGILLTSVVNAQTGQSAPAKQTTANAASGKGANPVGQKYDTKLPIEISSDTLEVLQHDNKAIFKGNVIAVQGQIRLKSDVMIVHYRQKQQTAGVTPGGTTPSGPPPAPKPVPGGDAPPAAGQSTMGAISLIEVEGNVFVATPEETAQGDKGDYQVDEKLLHLFGDNVVLTRDKNILRGTELLYNLETGRSTLTNGKGPDAGDVNGGRVRGVFVPNQDNGKNSKGGKVKKSATPANVPSPSSVPSAPAAAVSATAAPSSAQPMPSAPVGQ